MDKISAKLNAIDTAYLALVKHLAKDGKLDINNLADELISFGKAYSSTEVLYGEYVEKIGNRVKELAE
ncbi:hypothetical protein F9K98_13260 [Brucella anthropi]|uniref:hypothetical protein n=1 Tax=Brucella anthropi TaxID=529 RepID=UPI00124F3B1E|nr:hypothetical protein [Brucella anthropi]KAB2762757.1 hypothetical protein F9K98_13260 [Brucella anthropi]